MIRHHDRRSEQDIYLIPEFCVLTGITEQQKGRNFRAIKDEMFANAQTKNKEATRFFNTIKSSEKYESFTRKWKIEIDETPYKTTAHICGVGSIIGGSNKVFDLNNMKRDFSREFNSPYKAKKIKKWIILYSRETQQMFKSFMSGLKKTVTEDYHYQ